jgi:hypothetical protein
MIPGAEMMLTGTGLGDGRTTAHKCFFCRLKCGPPNSLRP